MAHGIAGPDSSLAIGLMSGGLDSLLAARVILMQGFRIIAYRFISPFFGRESRGREIEEEKAFAARHGMELRIRSVWPGYLDVVRNPRHGYGKNLNPCLDCKIFMLHRAGEELAREKAAFVFTGEVLGQRPMSQRRDALHLIENESGLKGRLVRPLSARLLPPSIPEQEGLLDRQRLLDFRGRSRKPQLDMARRLGISDYATPAGGCLLTDPGFAARLRRFFLAEEDSTPGADDIELLTVGRHFSPGARVRLVVGRNEAENRRIASLAVEGDLMLEARGLPGPLSVLRGPADDNQIILAAAITARYSDHSGMGVVPVVASRWRQWCAKETRLLSVEPATPGQIESLRA